MQVEGYLRNSRGSKGGLLLESTLMRRDVICTNTTNIAIGGASVGWQTNYFKISSQIEEISDSNGSIGKNISSTIVSKLVWFKKEGGMMVDFIDLTKESRSVKGMSVHIRACPRTLEYFPDIDCISLPVNHTTSDIKDENERFGIPVRTSLERAEKLEVEAHPKIESAPHINDSSTDPGADTFTLRIIWPCDRGNSGIEIRMKSVDEIILWTNTIARTAGLSYSVEDCAWTYTARKNLPRTVSDWNKNNSRYADPLFFYSSGLRLFFRPHWLLYATCKLMEPPSLIIAQLYLFFFR